MQVNLKSLNQQEVSSTTVEKKMQMSPEYQAMVFQMFTKGIYSNPKGTIVREITSNCKDSHTEAGVTKPIVIRKTIDKLAKTTSISFIDFGVGISPDRMENVYGVYFASTKRVDNQQIGGFGVGGKTPLAYRRSTGYGQAEYDNSFNIVTNYNGIKYTYLIYEGDECPMFSLQDEQPTDELNGTEVRVPVLEKDIRDFKKEMIRQLYYFEDVIFEGFDDVATDIILSNDYQIIRANTFLYRGEEYTSNVHVCLGKVAYPLDYNILGLDSGDFNFPVAIKIEVGEIGVTISRETLDYSEATIKLLKKKLLAVKAELVEMLGKQYENIVTLEDYFKVKNNFGHVYFPNGKSIDMGMTIEQKDIDFSNFRYSFLKMPNDKQLFRFFFESKLYGKKEVKGRRSWRYNSSNDNDTQAFEGSYEVLIAKKKALYYFNGEFERKIVKQAWLKEQHTRYYMITKNDFLYPENRLHYMALISDLFNVHDEILVRDKDGITTDEPTAYTKSLMEMQDEYFEIVKANCSDYESVIVPEAFIESRKREKITEEMRKITIPAKIISAYSSGQRVKLDALFNFNGTIFYGLKEEEDKLKVAVKTFGLIFNGEYVITGYNESSNTFRSPKKPCILFIRIAAGNVRYMEFCRKAYHINQFKVKMMYRKEDQIMNYFCSVNFVNKYNRLDDLYRHNGFKNICQKWGNKISKINAFISTLQASTKGKNWSSYTWELGQYFDLRDIAMTKEQLEFTKTIEELQEMQEVNQDTMKFINQPYNLNTGDDLAYWNLLKKVLAY
jgi:hypothetical protein